MDSRRYRADHDRRPAQARADKVYRAVAYGAGAGTLLIMGLIGAFLVIKAWPALRAVGLDFFTHSDWIPQAGNFGITGVLLGTILIAVVALVLAVPVATLAALFVTEYSPRRLRRPFTSFIDLLAAVPSVIYGLWGREFLQPREIHLSSWLANHLGFIPFFTTSRRVGLLVVDVHRRHGRRADDRPDLHRGDARGLLAGPAGREGRRARAGRHEVGRDPRRRAPVRQGRDDRRRRCSASAARSARRSR